LRRAAITAAGRTTLRRPTVTAVALIGRATVAAALRGRRTVRGRTTSTRRRTAEATALRRLAVRIECAGVGNHGAAERINRLINDSGRRRIRGTASWWTASWWTASWWTAWRRAIRIGGGGRNRTITPRLRGRAEATWCRSAASLWTAGLWTASLWTASLWTARRRTETARGGGRAGLWRRAEATGTRRRALRLRSTKGGRRDAEHRSFQLSARCGRSCGRGRRGGRSRHGGAGRRSAWSWCWNGRLQTGGRVHHQHRALELRGSGTFQAEPALLAGRRRFLVLGPTVRTKHSKTSLRGVMGPRAYSCFVQFLKGHVGLSSSWSMRRDPGAGPASKRKRATPEFRARARARARSRG
jgi:hypothetical protein